MTFLTFSCCQLFYLHRTIDRQSLEANFHVFARHSNALDRQENKSTTNFTAFSSDRKWKTYKASIFFFFRNVWMKKKKENKDCKLDGNFCLETSSKKLYSLGTSHLDFFRNLSLFYIFSRNCMRFAARLFSHTCSQQQHGTRQHIN